MSIDALVSGKLHAKPQQRMTKAGKPFCTCMVKAPVRSSGQDGEVCFVSVIAFADAAVTALLALEAGDSVAITGEATPKVYVPPAGGEPRASLDLLAHAVVSPYAVQRKRQAAQGSRDGGEHPVEARPAPVARGHQGEGIGGRAPWPRDMPSTEREPLRDELPF